MYLGAPSKGTAFIFPRENKNDDALKPDAKIPERTLDPFFKVTERAARVGLACTLYIHSRKER